MATTRTPRSPRNTRTGSNAMNIQRKINSDYAELARDYRKLAVELWQLPVTKFVVAGAALGAVAAVFKRYPELNTYVSEGVDGLKTKIQDVVSSGEDLVS